MLLLTRGPAPTVKLRNGGKNFTHSLAVYSRGGALLHPGACDTARLWRASNARPYDEILKER